MALETVGSYRCRGPEARSPTTDEGEAERLGPDASRLVVAPLPVELTAARAARFSWQRRFRAPRNRVSLGAIVAQPTIARIGQGDGVPGLGGGDRGRQAARAAADHYQLIHILGTRGLPDASLIIGPEPARSTATLRVPS